MMKQDLLEQVKIEISDVKTCKKSTTDDVTISGAFLHLSEVSKMTLVMAHLSL